MQTEHPFLGLSIACAGALALGLYVVKDRPSGGKAPFPPGPRRLPVIGNLRDWPAENEKETFARWAELYGDIVHLDLMGQHVYVVNSLDLALDLLARKGALFSERPTLYFGGEIVGWKHSIGMLPYGDRLRDTQKLYMTAIGTKAAIHCFEPMQEAAARRFLQRVLDAPDKLVHHIRTMISGIMFNVSNGYQVQEGDDPFVALNQRMMAEFSIAAKPGNFLVDTIPAIRHLPEWLPGMGWKRTARAMRATMRDALELPHLWAKEQLAAGAERPSFVATLCGGRALSAYEEDVVKWAAIAIHGGGTDTSTAALATFVLAMVLHPAVQARARAEIDSVVGRDRLLAYGDRARLPYVDAVCKEVLRWGPPVAVGVPHAAREDTVHAGQFFPQGAYVIPNIWGLARDPRLYTNPTAFEPARFLAHDDDDDDGGRPSARYPERDPREYVFGFGRRLCPGVELAEANIFIACATMLATLYFEKATDSEGVAIEPEVRFTGGGLGSHPAPFEYKVRPRGERAEALIRGDV